jgi:diguanylate cyclase (GGDEF)-like protein
LVGERLPRRRYLEQDTAPERFTSGCAGADGEEMVDTRVLALMVGVIGAAFGVAAVAADLPVLGLVAGGAALLAGVVAMVGTRASDVTADEAGSQAAATERDELLDSTRDELASAHRRIAELEAVGMEAPIGAVAPRAASGGAIGSDGVSGEAADLDSASGDGASGDGAGAEPAALTDPSSQLFSEAYFRVALQSRLASARRHLRPVAVCLLEVAEGQADDRPTAAPATRVAEAIRETLREADIACRLDDGSFAVILEDTPENGAVWTIERVRRNLVSRFGSHTMWAGVACYPAHAFSTEELLEQARAALTVAQEWKQDRIEVAVAD